MEFEGMEFVKQQDGEVLSHSGTGASAAELASIDLERWVEREWIEVEWQAQKTRQDSERVSTRVNNNRSASTGIVTEPIVMIKP